MGIFDWSPRYSVHIDEFDGHHKKLLEMLSEFHQAMLDGRAKDVVGAILDKLKEYTQYHFKAEEAKMNQYQYEHIEEHKSQHRKLIEQLDKLINDYKSGNVRITSETYTFLKNWLTNHIMKADKQYTAFFKEKGL